MSGDEGGQRGGDGTSGDEWEQWGQWGPVSDLGRLCEILGKSSTPTAIGGEGFSGDDQARSIGRSIFEPELTFRSIREPRTDHRSIFEPN